MPDPADATSWVTPVLAFAAAIGTGAGAIWVRIWQARKPAVPDGPGFVAVAGTLQDSKALARLTDQLAENGRSMRDSERTNREVERATLELCRTMAQAADQLGDVLRFMEQRDKREKSEEARMMRIIETSRGKGS